jgi:lipopolysaccharide cholinephosphotransferase
MPVPSQSAEMTAEEVRRVQLDCLIAFTDFCDANNLKYYLAFGTLLGAVRHHGFIPWDDDIDVMMSREDLQKLPSTIPAIDGSVDLQVGMPGREEWAYPFVKICDPRSRSVSTAGQAEEFGVGIDVFPIDNGFPGASARRAHLAALAVIRRMYFLRCGSARRPGRSMVRSVLYPLLMVLIRPLSQRFVASLWWRVAGIPRAVANTTEVGIVVGHSSWYVPRTMFGPGQELTFEGLEVRAPTDWDGILRRLYGDYLTPPPVEKRTSTHAVRCLWSTPTV